jgi:hypothetical protein
MARWTDQERMAPVRNARTTALAQIQSDVGPVAHRLADQFLQAIDFQLVADFRYREAERIEALGLEIESTPAARRSAERYNTACLDLLVEEVPAAIEEVRRQFGDQIVDFGSSLGVMEQEGLEQILDMDLKGEHAATAGRTLREIVAVANESGVVGLCDNLQNQASQLVELRRRRPEHNDPVIVIVGAIICGLAATILAICWATGGPGGCRNPTVLFLVALMFTLGGFLLAAELLAFIGPPPA